MCALLGVMVAGLAQGATIRYHGSGDYNDIYAVTLVNGWEAGGGGPGGLPGSMDTIRCNWADNTVTLTNVAPDVARFQFGVDQSGRLVVESGGSLTAVGGSANRVGNNGGVSVTGRLTVKTNGVVNSISVLEVGAAGGTPVTPSTGILTIDGGTVNCSSHLWVGSGLGTVGTIILTNGGTLNLLGAGGNGMLGLGSPDGVKSSGGTGTIKVTDGSVLNLYNIEPGLTSIQGASVLDIAGSGVVTIPGDRVTVMSNYTYVGKITAYAGTGTVAIDYNTSNPGKTTLKAVGGYAPPTDALWNPAGNPSSTGLWSQCANWTNGLCPVSVTKVLFNVLGAMPCTVNSSAPVDSVVMGTNGPGGTLIITNGGSLACGADNATVIGANSNALLVVENGGSASFSSDLWVGYDPGSDGTFIMNGGTVSVGGKLGLGWHGGKGTAHINGGTLNLAQWDFLSLQANSVLDVAGTGMVVVNGGGWEPWLDYYISMGWLTANGGAGTVVVDYNNINAGKTTIYPFGLDLAPALDVWTATNSSSSGLWSDSANWSAVHCPGDVTVVTFNTPDAVPCTVTNAAVARQVSMGNGGGPGGTLIITNGGSLTTGNQDWSAVGYSSNALMIVQNGGSASFGYHLWVGFDPGADGTLLINGGTVSVGAMFGLGWNGGKGTAIVTNGGTLNLSQWHPTDSIKGPSVLDISGTSTVVITGNYVTSVGNFVSSGKITAAGSPNVVYGFDSGANKTILQAAPPRPSVAISVGGGNTTLTYQTTAGHIYHVESTASLSPPAWTRVAGSTTNAASTAVTFTFPTAGNQRFYRAVSP